MGRGDGEARGVGGSYPLVDDAGEPVRWRPRPSGRSSSRRRPRVGVGLLGRGLPLWTEAQGSEGEGAFYSFYFLCFYYFLFYFAFIFISKLVL